MGGRNNPIGGFLKDAGMHNNRDGGNERVREAIEKTRQLRKEMREEFEKNKEEADRVRARAVLQSLDAIKLINRRSNGF